MRTVHKSKTVSWSANGQSTIELVGLPTEGVGDMVPHLAAIEIVGTHTVTTPASTGALTSQEQHKALNSLTMNVGGPWGPVNLNGEQLAELFFLQSGRRIPYGSSSSGDSAVGASASGVTRIVRSFFSFENFGPIDDPFMFCPPTKRLKTGSLELGYSATPANVTTLAVTYQAFFHIIWLSRSQSVAKIKAKVTALTGAGQTLTEKGLLIRAALLNKTADAAAADFTAIQFYLNGGTQIVDIAQPMDLRAIGYGSAGAKVTSAELQENFADPLGGNFVRAINLYPMDVRVAAGDLPVGNTWKIDYQGAPTVANWQVLTVVAEQTTRETAVETLIGCGCGGLEEGEANGKKVPPSHVLVPLGKGGSVLKPGSRISGFTPVVAVPRGSTLGQIAQAMGHTI